MRTLPFAGWHGLAGNLPFIGDLRQPFGTPGLLSGDHLVTMGVHINLWGAMQPPPCWKDCPPPPLVSFDVKVNFDLGMMDGC